MDIMKAVLRATAEATTALADHPDENRRNLP